jgi:hypothetical protein
VKKTALIIPSNLYHHGRRIKMLKLFTEVKIRQPKKIKMVGEPGLPAHESILRPLRQNEIDGMWKERMQSLWNKLKGNNESPSTTVPDEG